MDHNNDLLRPSLSADHNPAAAIYSARTVFLTSFFGGPIAGAAVALINAYRLRSLATDWPLGLIAVGLCVELAWMSTHHGWSWLDAIVGDGSAIYGTRIVNLIFFAIAYAFHRTYYKSMSVLGITPPNGLLVGLGAICLGVLAEVAIGQVFAI
jgi:hypothetical protein